MKKITLVTVIKPLTKKGNKFICLKQVKFLLKNYYKNTECWAKNNPYLQRRIFNCCTMLTLHYVPTNYFQKTLIMSLKAMTSSLLTSIQVGQWKDVVGLKVYTKLLKLKKMLTFKIKTKHWLQSRFKTISVFMISYLV
jgi:hypothetical protein